MNKLKKLLLTLISVMGLVSLTSCDEKYTDFDLDIYCTPDMLEYVIPTIDVTINGGERVKKTLSLSDFEMSEGKTTFNATDKTIYLYKYTYHKRCDKSEIEGTASISFSLIPNAAYDKDVYFFSSVALMSYTLVNEIAYKNNYELVNTIEYTDNNTRAEEIIKDLCSRTYEKSFSAKMK